MNIIHIISNKVWGGGERYALDLCRRSAADGHSVAVLSRRIPEVARRFTDAGIPVGYLPLRGALDPFTPTLLARVLNRMAAPVVVHVHNFKDAAMAVRARRLMTDQDKVRIVCTRHLVKAAKTGRSATALFSRLDAIVFVSELARDEFLSTSPAVASEKLHVVHNSVIVPDAVAVPEEKNYGPVRLVFAGRLVAEKGLEVLVRAMGELSDLDLRLTVCGSGDSRDVMPVVRLARGLDIASRIEWAGHVDDVYAYIRRADIGVVPSVCRESFGLTVVEFMSQGLPVVSTSNGAQKEIITDGRDGLLVPPSDVAALAAAIRRLAGDEALRRDLGEAARQTFESRFSYERFYGRMLGIYRGDSL